MWIRRQDLSVLLFYYLGYSRLKNLFLRIQHKPVARFVTFHDLIPESLRFFESNLTFLKKNTNVISLDDYFKGKMASEEINTVITFDDGYKGWVTNALPILKRLKLPASFFVSSGFVGLTKEEEKEFVRTKLLSNPMGQKITGSLSLVDIKKIVDNGFIIGGHTINHCKLTAQKDINQLKFEIIEDKLRLEKITGIKVNYFAYPSGQYNSTVVNVMDVISVRTI